MFVYPKFNVIFSQGNDGKYVADSGIEIEGGEDYRANDCKLGRQTRNAQKSYDNLNAFSDRG